MTVTARPWTMSLVPIRTMTPARRDRWARLVGSVLLAALAACGSARKKEEVEVEVLRVALDETSRSPVVLLQDKEHRVALPIWVGLAEAQSIAMQLEGIQAPRPLTHDLMKNVLDSVGVEFRRVFIHELREGTYLARIELRSNGNDVAIDSRPSDGIALAVRFKKPIFVAAALLEQDQAVDLRTIRGADTMIVDGMTIQALTGELAEYFDLPAGSGVLVADVPPGGSPTLRRGDVILAIDGSPVRDPEDFRRKMGAVSGRTSLEVQRAGGRVRLAYESAPR